MNALTTTSSISTPEILRLVDGLAPVDNDTISRCIHWLIKSGLALPGAITVDTFRQVYGFALAARATAAVRIVTEKLTHGDYGEEYARFIPTPAMFSALAANEQARLVADLAREKAKANPQSDGRSTPAPTDEERARVHAKRLEFRLQSAELKVSEADKAAAQNMTEDEKQMWSRIMSLPDRKGSTFPAEERQNRNRIIANMETAR